MQILDNLNFWILVGSLIGLTVSWRFWVYYSSLLDERFRQPLYPDRARLALLFLALFGLGLFWSLSNLVYVRITAPLTPAPSAEAPAASPSATPGAVSPFRAQPPTATTVGEAGAAAGPAGAPASPSPGEGVELQTARIGNTNTLGANLRASPGLDGELIESLSDRTRITLLGGVEEADGFTWQSVQLEDGRQGWIANNFIILD